MNQDGSMQNNEALYRARILRRLRSYFKPGLKVLDAGCGPGGVAEIFTDWGCRVTAVDLEPHPAVWAQRARLGIEFRQASAEALDYPDASFDVVWVMDALHHMADPKRGLAELARVAKPGAPLIVVESNRQNPLLYVRMTLIARHETFTRRQMRRMLDAVDRDYLYYMVESRCLPWSWPWLLALQNLASDGLERLRMLDPWLTYQVAVLRGWGRKSRPEARP
jgi:ubiquinone/menaquinone biosynthesis C-methylase UbiE